MSRRGPASFAALVRDSRQRLHLTQRELARRVGVSRSEIAEIEAGRIASPRAPVLLRLADALRLPAAALLMGSAFAVGEASGEIVDPEELVLLATSLVALAGKDRRWLRDSLLRLRERLAARGGRRRARRRSGRGG